MANTSTNINARIFSPYVVIGGEEKRRLLLTLKSSEGYSINSGITLGDVIRYSPSLNGYTLSQANTDENAEVVGIVESISGDAYNIVASGSVKYPVSRLNAIVGGGAGGVDVLFLDEKVAGGLTGTINIDTGEKLVKPVLQVAPHGEYNGIVLNQIGYKTGNRAVLELDKDILPVGSIIFLDPSVIADDIGDSYRIVVDTQYDSGKFINSRLSFSDYPDFYSFFSNNSITHSRVLRIKLDDPYDISYLNFTDFQSATSLPVLSNSSFQIVGGGSGGEGLQYTAFIYMLDETDVNYISLYFINTFLSPTGWDDLLSRVQDPTKTLQLDYILGIGGEISLNITTKGNPENKFTHFIPKPIPSSRKPTVGTTTTGGATPASAFYKIKKDSFLVRVPSELTIDTLKIDTSLELTGTNLETRLSAIEAKLANICTNIGLGC